MALLLLQEQVEMDKSLIAPDDHIRPLEVHDCFTYIALYIYHFIIKFIFFSNQTLADLDVFILC